MAPFAYLLEDQFTEKVSSSFNDRGDVGVGEKILFLLNRFNAVNCILVVTRETQKSLVPER